jgi:hypothetical protein
MTKRKSTWGNMAAYSRDRHETTKAGPRQIVPSKSLGHYSPALHSPSTATRVGANDALALPSRMGEQLIYRDGNTALFQPSETTP